jgi:hypothetical protein
MQRQRARLRRSDAEAVTCVAAFGRSSPGAAVAPDVDACGGEVTAGLVGGGELYTAASVRAGKRTDRVGCRARLGFWRVQLRNYPCGCRVPRARPRGDAVRTGGFRRAVVKCTAAVRSGFHVEEEGIRAPWAFISLDFDLSPFLIFDPTLYGRR